MCVYMVGTHACLDCLLVANDSGLTTARAYYVPHLNLHDIRPTPCSTQRGGFVRPEISLGSFGTRPSLH